MKYGVGINDNVAFNLHFFSEEYCGESLLTDESIEEFAQNILLAMAADQDKFNEIMNAVLGCYD